MATNPLEEVDRLKSEIEILRSTISQHEGSITTLVNDYELLCDEYEAYKAMCK